MRQSGMAWRIGRRGTVLVGAVVAILLVLAGVALLRGPEPVRQAREDFPHVVDAAPATTAIPAIEGADLTRPRATPDWVRRTARRTDIPRPAVRAYADAALMTRAVDPSCRLGWTTLAGIGKIESRHGTYAGRTLRADGTSSRKIIGIALDGREGVKAIPATPEDTARHGDPRWDHAVGPLQFIGSTWARWGADGDGNGTRDPFDLDDAVVAAARYLCANDRDLATADGWNAGVWSYNRSRSYLRTVAENAGTYAEDVAGPA